MHHGPIPFSETGQVRPVCFTECQQTEAADRASMPSLGFCESATHWLNPRDQKRDESEQKESNINGSFEAFLSEKLRKLLRNSLLTKITLY